MLLVASALALSACSTPSADSEATAAPADTSAEAPATESTEEAATADTPADSAELDPELQEGGAAREAAVEMMADWFINKEAAPHPELPAMVSDWTGEVANDYRGQLVWEERDHNLAGRQSPQVPVPYPAFDTTLARMDDPNDTWDFMGVGIRLAHEDVTDFTDGILFALENSTAPKLPGMIMTSEDENYYYLAALLDMQVVTIPSEEAAQQFNNDLFNPISFWRSTIF